MVNKIRSLLGGFMKSSQDALSQPQIRDVFEPVSEPARTLYLTR
jgi:hypothetical protein